MLAPKFQTVQYSAKIIICCILFLSTVTCRQIVDSLTDVSNIFICALNQENFCLAAHNMKYLNVQILLLGRNRC